MILDARGHGGTAPTDGKRCNALIRDAGHPHDGKRCHSSLFLGRGRPACLPSLNRNAINDSMMRVAGGQIDRAALVVVQPHRLAPGLEDLRTGRVQHLAANQLGHRLGLGIGRRKLDQRLGPKLAALQLPVDIGADVTVEDVQEAVGVAGVLADDLAAELKNIHAEPRLGQNKDGQVLLFAPIVAQPLHRVNRSSGFALSYPTPFS